MPPAPPILDREVEDALIPLSALQHHLFCPRQCALIHVEQLWAEDAATAEGQLLHAKADAARPETRPGVRVARGLAVRSLALGVAGRADVVEFSDAGAAGRGQPFPVEYKRGRPKAHRADEVQLCAQAICLEEMFGTAVPEGALFYGETRRRHPVAFDGELRALTARVAAETRAMIAAMRTPPPVRTPACKRCSLLTLCQPARLEKAPSVRRWLAAQIGG
ncbi:CRISPR-associated protein Cas4 [Inquilinus sp. Marseille-Q2685]|uniref:CRISPR-associated protein Cas4 n=1 Tax=Inquilinus sp. Marseille-Q2685 TaxID=2866581 RepID=UPI001CE4214B|nr:CRISPR-associated protein Cas4 [Inquilinus sp. Marseille-Q2685]